MVEIYVILSLVIGIGIGYTLANHSKSSDNEDIDLMKKEMENTFKALASDVNKSNTEEFFKLANDKFQTLSKEFVLILLLTLTDLMTFRTLLHYDNNYIFIYPPLIKIY